MATSALPPRVLVMTATYNELENLPALTEEIFAYLPAAQLLIVDDHSPDGTGRWAAERAASDPRVFHYPRAGKQGLGTAIIAGMRWALERDYDYLVNLDADFSHHPRYLPALVAGMNSQPEKPVDVLIGSRYTTGGAIAGWPLRRHLMSRGVNLYARWMLWLTPRDCSGGYRCYRVSTLAKLDFSQIRSRGYSFQEEILWRLRKLGARFAETPITFTDRERGLSKINTREALHALGLIARLGLYGG